MVAQGVVVDGYMCYLWWGDGSGLDGNDYNSNSYLVEC